ncbi:MFS transporter [Humibacter ginsenosidimutans]|uniref:MFS transporter n=1 Tax=Humibacter ginsenosidimutans TaxID=2599293 RepID=A0A5B8M633_9MICO|nr:MFS transporter [Humibacter ginsenosidimutans]QDZ15736.1 MFS transporter [Humibacter ginsenosidimutans]
MRNPGEQSTFSLLLGATGKAYFPIAFIARFPYAMIVVGVLTLIVTMRHSLALGGLVSACVGLGTAAVGPLIGAAADRFGQRRVVLAAGIANGITLLLIAWAASAAPDAIVLAVALLIGATAPQVSPLSRSRLVGIISTRMPVGRRAGILNSTFSYESAADEVTFVFGPVLVGALATTVGPQAAVIGAALLEFVFVTAFALHPTSRLAAHETAVREREPVGALLRPPLLVLIIGSVGVGLFFGAMLTSLTAIMTVLGSADQSGLMYGAMGVGSAAFALGVALFPARFTLRARWLTFAAVLFIGAGLFALLSGSIGGILTALFLAGIGVGPTLVTLYSLAAVRSPAGRSATVMTMLGSGIVVGQAAASGIVGALASATSAHAAGYAPVIAALIVLAAALVNWPLSRPDRARA